MNPQIEFIGEPALIKSKYAHIRQEVAKFLLKFIQPGDILFRLGNAKAFNVIPFSFIVAGVTQSHYSHAAMIANIENNVVNVADVDIYGFQIKDLPSWLNDCIGPFLGVYRLKDFDETKKQKVIDLFKKWRNLTILYNSNFIDVNTDFDNHDPVVLYCTQMVDAVCRYLGYEMKKSKIKLSEAPGIASVPEVVIDIATKKFGVNLNQDMVVVGNENLGLLANEELEPLAVIVSDGTNWQTVKGKYQKLLSEKVE
jgi:hypothetical protein